MTLEEWTRKFKRNGLIDPGAPVYLEEDKEAARLRWIVWRNRVDKVLHWLLLTGGMGTKRANAVMDFIWPFPVGTKAR